MRAPHPLDPLDAEEIRLARALVLAAHRELQEPRFVLIALADPPKDVVVAFEPGRPCPRAAEVVVFERATRSTYESRVDLDARSVVEWRRRDGVQPAILPEEYEIAAEAALADPDFRRGLERRGVDPSAHVQVDPLAVGFQDDVPAGSRCLWATPYLRPRLEDNGYARPLENLRALVDVASGEVLRVVDGPIVPVPDLDGNYDEEAAGGFRDDLRRVEIAQPGGVSFSVEGHTVTWQRWRVHVSLHPVDGLVLHDLRYHDEGRPRQVLYRASVAEMVVPYGDPGDGYYWRSYFDAGEYGLGRTTGSLELGCDCLGEIHYFDAVLADGSGEPVERRNVICLHEEDAGTLWKHVDGVSGRAEVRRSRRLVISSFSTIGNYDYGFFWYLHLDGRVEFEVKLTGIVLTQAVEPGGELSHASRIAPGLAAPLHQHLFNVRLDLAVDGFANSVEEVDLVAAEPGEGNPHGGAMVLRRRPIERESEGRRSVDPVARRRWRISNPGALNPLGEPVAYELVPHDGPVLLADPGSSVGRRAEFARHHLWVTRYAPDERHAAGDYPNQNPGGDGLPRWTQADRELVGTDVVLWHTLGVSHEVRPEDWPVMPVDRIGFTLRPVGFFARNPALDVPPGAGSGAHSGCQHERKDDA